LNLDRRQQKTEEKLPSNKTVYIEEQVKVLERVILAADPLLSELTTMLQDFQQIAKKPALQRDIDLQKKYGV
jgi:hypothetical protein